MSLDTCVAAIVDKDELFCFHICRLIITIASRSQFACQYEVIKPAFFLEIISEHYI